MANSRANFIIVYDTFHFSYDIEAIAF